MIGPLQAEKALGSFGRAEQRLCMLDPDDLIGRRMADHQRDAQGAQAFEQIDLAGIVEKVLAQTEGPPATRDIAFAVALNGVEINLYVVQHMRNVRWRADCCGRKRVVWGKSVSVRVDLGGGRII